MAETQKDNFLINIFGILWRGKWIIVVCGIVTGAAVFLFAMTMTSVYSSTITVLLPQNQAGGMGMLGMLSGMGNLGGLMPTSVDLDAAIMTSGSVLEEVAVEYGLLADTGDIPLNGDKTPYLADFHANSTASGNDYTFEFLNDDGDYIVYGSRGRFVGSGANFARFNGNGLNFVMACYSPVAGDSFEVELMNVSGAAKVLADTISASPSTGDTIEVSSEGSSPAMAQNIVTAVVNKYIERTETYQAGSTGQLRSFLENKVNELEAKMESAARELAKYAVEEQIFDPEKETTTALELMGALEEQRLLTKIRRQVVEELIAAGALDEASMMVGAQSAALAGVVVPATSQLEVQLDTLNTQLAALLTRFTEEHPQVIELQGSIESIEKQLREKQMNLLEGTLEQLRTTEVSLQREVDNSFDKLSERPDKYIDYTKLEMKISGYREVYKFLMAQYEQARLDEQKAISNRGIPRIVSPASYESKAVRPRKMIYGLAGGILGGFIGIGLALSRHYFRRTRFFGRLRDEMSRRDEYKAERKGR
ncbi:hypothetical protein K8R78_05525 [bacterium]|nr:hypothetical protein [bacterium]